jgi:predicted DCC family thiol-disulfide oxidoreductase YuxK
VARHPALGGADSVVWLEPATATRPERALVRSAAALRVVGYLGGAWTLLWIAWLVPRPLRDAVYDLMARHRHRLSGDPCVVPGPEQRSRFLDLG